MTEEEAKTKWCPFARVATSHAKGRPINRVGSESGQPELIAEADCIGSACMAWRWSAPVVVYGSDEIGDSANHFLWKPPGDGWDFKDRRWQKETPAGFCGLAGKP